MNSSRRAFGAIVVSVCLATSLSGCSQWGAVETTHAHGAIDQMTTINGEPPVGTPHRLLSSTRLIDETSGGQRHIVYRDVRGVGTRAAIHIHPYGGSTCVLSGEVTIFIEDKEPQTATPGDCYWMPPNIPMYAVNSGDTDAVIYDTFNIPPDADPWIVVEPGMEDMVQNFG